MRINRRPMPISRWLLLLFGLSFVCIGTLVIVGDQLCSRAIEQRIPFYPEAAVVSTTHNYIRPRAIGSSIVVLVSDDDVETVRQFYRDVTIAIISGGQARGLASTNWAVEPASDGTGSIIVLRSECGT